MLKKACMFGLVAASTIVSFASVARADSAINVQSASQNAAAVGNFNQIYQGTTQVNEQYQMGGSYNGSTPNTAINSQQANQAAAAIGDRNVIMQQLDQRNVQQQISKPMRMKMPRPFSF